VLATNKGEAVELSIFYQWQLLVTILLLVAGIFLLFKREKDRASRFAARATGVFALLLFPFGVLFVACDINATMYTLPLFSPSGDYSARAVVFRGSALDVDYAKVIVWRKSSSLWRTAYEGDWLRDENGGPTPFIKWANDRSLEIQVPPEYYNAKECSTSVYGIHVECVPKESIQ